MEFQEYPKMLFPPGAKPNSTDYVIVNSKEEEDAVLASWAPPPDKKGK